MTKIELQPKKLYHAKSKNRRITVWFYVDSEGKKDPVFRIKTKRLVSFQKRAITTTDNMFSIETFEALYNIMDEVLTNDHDVIKLINRHLTKTKWNCSVINNQTV